MEEYERETAWGKRAQAGDLAGAVEAYVKARDWVTFVELSNMLAPYIEVNGTLAIELLPNVILWADMSEEFADVIKECQQRKLIFPHPASFWSYLFDGGMLKLPLAVRPPGKGYKKEHWAPVCFRSVPIER